MTLTAEQAAAAWSTLGEQPEAARPEVPTAVAPDPIRKHYRPLVDAASAFIKEAQDRNRIYTGTPQFDAEMRGIGSGQLLIVTGYSHSGKTQWVTRMLRHNKGKRIAFFIPDEPATLVLSKLASIESGVAAREIEERVSEGDAEAIRILRDTALRDFPNLAVFDKPLTAQVMEEGYAEVCDVWGAKPDLVIVDYVDLVQVGETVQAKFDFLKGFGSRHEVPLLAIHQTSRSAGADGRKMTISSGNYGGEQHATFMIGVRRRKSQLMAELEELKEKANKGNEQAADRLMEVEYDLAIHQYTITVNLVKNKRPGGGLVDDVDMEIDIHTGRLTDLDGDLPRQYREEVERKRMQRAAPELQQYRQEYPTAAEQQEVQW